MKFIASTDLQLREKEGRMLEGASEFGDLEFRRGDQHHMKNHVGVEVLKERTTRGHTSKASTNAES